MTSILLFTWFLASPKRQVDEVRLKPEFYVAGELYADGPAASMIMSPGKRLVLRLPNGQSLWIQDLRRLKGHVEIWSPRQALSFVRLWGSPLTAGTIGGSDAFEIATKSEIDGLSFGDTWCRSVLSKSHSRMFGIVSVQTMHIEALRPVTVKVVSGGFQISRDVLTVRFGGPTYEDLRILRMREFVKKDGEYFAKVVSSRTASDAWRQGSPL